MYREPVRVLLLTQDAKMYREQLKNTPMKEYYIYILECADKTYYTGFTSNLEKRIQEHESGKYKDSYTYKRRPVKLIFPVSSF